MQYLHKIALILFLFSTLTSAQIPDTLWTYAYSENPVAVASCIEQTSDDGFIICGTANYYTSEAADLLLLKLDADGDTMWTKILNTGAQEIARCVRQTPGGGYIITGAYDLYGINNKDVYLVKTDANGDTLWTRTFGGANDDEGYSLCLTDDSGFIIAGTTSSFGGWLDVYIIKTDSLGNEEWYRSYGDSYFWDFGYDIAQTLDGGYIICGKTAIWGGEYFDSYLLRTDESGDTLWTRVIPHYYENEAKSIKVTPDGGYIYTGATTNPHNYYEDVLLVKTDSEGIVEWSHTYDNGFTDIGNDFDFADDGGYIIVGQTGTLDDCDILVLRTDAMGDTVWTTTFTRGINNIGNSVIRTNDGGFIIAGDSNEGYFIDSDVWILRLEAEEASAGNFQATPPQIFQLSTPYPNPFNPETTISFTLPSSGQIEVSVFDVMGKEVAVLASGEYSAGKHSITFNGKYLSSGVYFVRLNAENRNFTKKCLLLK